MKKPILMIFSLIAVALLFTSAGGCLEKSNAGTASTPGFTTTPGFIDSVVIYEKDGNIVASIRIIIQGTYAQTLDKENITVTLNANNIDVFVPVVTKDGPNTRDIGYETVEVILGKSSDFKNGEKYNVFVNGDKLKYTFMIEEGVLTTFVPATIETIEIKTDGKNVIAVVKTSMSGSQSVDTASIIKSKSFQNNAYDIYIPMKTVGSIITLDIKQATEEFVLGELSQFEDGIYTININKQNITFEIKNSTLIDSSQ